MVSVPLVATMTTDSYAAGKKGKRHHHRAKAPAAAETVQPPFATIVRALDDLGRQLATGGAGKR